MVNYAWFVDRAIEATRCVNSLVVHVLNSAWCFVHNCVIIVDFVNRELTHGLYVDRLLTYFTNVDSLTTSRFVYHILTCWQVDLLVANWVEDRITMLFMCRFLLILPLYCVISLNIFYVILWSSQMAHEGLIACHEHWSWPCGYRLSMDQVWIQFDTFSMMIIRVLTSIVENNLTNSPRWTSLSKCKRNTYVKRIYWPMC